MATVATLRAVFSADTRSLDQGIAHARAGLRSVATDARSVGTLLTAGLTVPLLGFGAAAVRAATEMDSLKRGLTAVAGSAAEADAQLARLREVAKLPGLGQREAIRAAIALQAAGISAARSERALVAFGNALATVGKGKAELDGVVLALSQIASKGKVSAEEINQLAERVPQIRQVMQAAFGTADTEALQKAKLSTTEFVDGVTRELLKLPRVTGGAQNAFENLSDAVNQAMARLGQDVLPTVATVVERLADSIGNLTSAFAGLPESARAGILIFGGLVAAAGPLVAVFSRLVGPARVLISVIGALVAAFRVGGAIQGLRLALAALGGPIGLVIAAVAGLALAWANNWGSIRDITATVVQFITTLVGEFAAGLGQTWAGLTDAAAGHWKRGWDQILAGTKRSLAAISKATQDAADGDVQRLKERLEKEQKLRDEAARKQAKAKPTTPADPGDKVDLAARARAQEVAAEGARFDKLLAETQRKLKLAKDGMTSDIQDLAAQFASVDIGDVQNLAGLQEKLQGLNRVMEETKQQQGEFAAALRDATDEQRMLLGGVSDELIRLTQQFPRLTAKEREHLAAVLEKNAVLRKERQDLVAVKQRTEELATKVSLLNAKTMEQRVALELTGKSFNTLSAATKEQIRDAAEYQATLDAAEAKEKRLKEVREANARALEDIRKVNRDAVQGLDVLRDRTEENVLAWERFGKAFRDLGGDAREAVAALADVRRAQEADKAILDKINADSEAGQAQTDPLAQRFLAANRELLKLKDTTLEGAIAADVFDSSMADLDAETRAWIVSVADAERAVLQQKTAVDLGTLATRGWASAMATAAVKEGQLRQQLDLLRDSSDANKISWDLFGVSLSMLDDEFVELALHLADLQAQIDATTKKKEAIQELARQTQGIFEEAFGKLDEGFGAFFNSVIQGVEEMLQNIAKQFLAAQLTNLIFGALGGGAPADAGPVGGLFGGLFGGGRTGGIAGPVNARGGAFGMPGRAMGGPVAAGRAFLVGERGPEMFVPGQSGTVVPNEAMGGGVTVVMNISTPDAGSFRQARAQVQADALRLAQAAQRRTG